MKPKNNILFPAITVRFKDCKKKSTKKPLSPKICWFRLFYIQPIHSNLTNIYLSWDKNIERVTQGIIPSFNINNEAKRDCSLRLCFKGIVWRDMVRATYDTYEYACSRISDSAVSESILDLITTPLLQFRWKAVNMLLPYTVLYCKMLYYTLPGDDDGDVEGVLVLAEGGVHHRGRHCEPHHGVRGRHACTTTTTTWCWTCT